MSFRLQICCSLPVSIQTTIHSLMHIVLALSLRDTWIFSPTCTITAAATPHLFIVLIHYHALYTTSFANKQILRKNFLKDIFVISCLFPFSLMILLLLFPIKSHYNIVFDYKHGNINKTNSQHSLSTNVTLFSTFF